MDILFVLIPLSVVLVLFVLAGLWWAIHTGQFEDVNREGERILRDDDAAGEVHAVPVHATEVRVVPRHMEEA